MRPTGRFVAVALVVLMNHAASASVIPPKSDAVDPAALVSQMVQRETLANKRHDQLWRYRVTIQKEGKKEVRDVVQTSDGEVYRVLAIDGASLNEEKQIETLDPTKAVVERKKLNQDTSTAEELLRMLPTAFRYECVGTQGTLVELKFSPNPNFHPSGWLGSVLRHINGTMWIDRRDHRLARLDGRLTSEVRFGWGFAGHLDRGGTFSIKRQDVGGGNWEMASIILDLDGKALLLKSIALREEETFGNFEGVPCEITMKEATGILLRNDFATE